MALYRESEVMVGVSTELMRVGVAAWKVASAPFLLVLFHPTTTEYAGARRQMDEVLEALLH